MSKGSVRLVICSLVGCLVFAPAALAKRDAGWPADGGGCRAAERALMAAGALKTFDDYIEDTRGPDICGENAVTNDNEGTITFGLHIHNRNSWRAGEHFGVFLDTDSNPTTGAEGAEYRLSVTSEGVQLDKWDGAAFVPQTTLPPAAWVPSYGPVFQLKASDLGGAQSFSFFFYATDGTNVDFAPDRDAWAYQLQPLQLSARPLTLDRPRAGRAFTARMLVMRSDFDIELTEGTIACSAKLGTRTLVGTGRFAGPRVACTWRLPRGSQRKRLSGTVGVTFQGVEAKRAFSVAVRK